MDAWIKDMDYIECLKRQNRSFSRTALEKNAENFKDKLGKE